MIKRWLVRIYGVVQGVGFRPFIYNLASKYQLSGLVGNDTQGVFLEIEGSEEVLNAFVQQIPIVAPPMAVIDKIEIINTELPISMQSGFIIVKSQGAGDKQISVPVDTALCSDCEKELLTPEDRRYLYPFINCTNCGPRYTIIEALPYDRFNTTMKTFQMCPECAAEYNDPTNRRFHAQPNACWHCGPQVSLLDRQKNIIARGIEAIKQAGEFLSAGKIIAIKGLGGFHLACDARNSDVVKTLRRRKNREEKALAVMCKDINTLKAIVQTSIYSEKILQGPEKPILLLPKKDTQLLADEIAPVNPNYGVMLPYTPLHRVLFEFSPPYLVMTSANKTDEPIEYKNDEAVSNLNQIADYFLLHDREIKRRCDDSVATVFRDKLFMIRRSRGFAPLAIKLPEEFSHIIATGAEQKNVIAIAKGKDIILSHHLGDLENEEAYRAFEECINDLTSFLDLKPRLIVHDLHPEYLATKWALEQPVAKLAIQHHEAHIGACMLEHQLAEPVIGIAFDGTGYGYDGTLWGSEVFIGDGKDFRRVAHLLPIPLIGGEKAIREVWRLGYVLQELAGIKEKNANFNNRPEISIFKKMLSNHLNVFLSTGMGRLFDGVAAILNLREKITYDGQAAIELENIAYHSTKSIPLKLDIIQQEKKWFFDWRPLIQQISAYLRKGEAISTLAFGFHLAIANAINEICLLIRNQYGINKVCLSGGVFMNQILLRESVSRLEQDNFEVYWHQTIPCNDGGIAAGQIYLAYLRSEK
ncbi:MULTISPECIES: carbamoyltransferase HypF [Carboxydocella]|uniref:Carbamoyltransferase n=2 Tax=Carboxydocella TaxID=178898 RepID=A0A1T4LQP1_9FIRM|nr:MULTISPECIES: carbamoyltransferase HypF [Carboxydocella]AVX20560.1 hydrogenase maturation protein HypF [Carboxydocella thermautotrophica]GAW29622.1 carbamoyltransferase HypF [Carboxydocella sp. ULO1]GAW31487.1 carbamoyltransferase HypF [Carboxydocella sp. JDF658]SJZ56838.1 hydrogenase maturation protein HypF [Carboxydocella sporoproducens DSM 16521]